MQSNNQIKLITIPAISKSPLCPVSAISNLLCLTPLFQVKNAQTMVPLTDSKLRRHFALVLNRLYLAHSDFTLHTFRCSGATFVYIRSITKYSEAWHPDVGLCLEVYN